MYLSCLDPFQKCWRCCAAVGCLASESKVVACHEHCVPAEQTELSMTPLYRLCFATNTTVLKMNRRNQVRKPEIFNSHLLHVYVEMGPSEMDPV